MEIVTTIGISPATTQFTERRISELGYSSTGILTIMLSDAAVWARQWEPFRGACVDGQRPRRVTSPPGCEDRSSPAQGWNNFTNGSPHLTLNPKIMGTIWFMLKKSSCYNLRAVSYTQYVDDKTSYIYIYHCQLRQGFTPPPPVSHRLLLIFYAFF